MPKRRSTISNKLCQSCRFKIRHFPPKFSRSLHRKQLENEQVPLYHSKRDKQSRLPAAQCLQVCTKQRKNKQVRATLPIFKKMI